MSYTTTFVGKMKEFGGSVGDKAKELTARAKTNLSMVDVESDMEGVYKTLGKLVFAASKAEPAQASEEQRAAMEQLCAKLREQEQVLNTLRARSQELRKVKVCACGQENSMDGSFCTKCGIKLD